jgi:hypothetical protein
LIVKGNQKSKLTDNFSKIGESEERESVIDDFLDEMIN